MVRTFTAAALASCLLFAAGYGIPPGKYIGTYSGEQSGGKIEIRLIGSDKKVESASVMFTYNGSDIQTRLREFKTAGDSLEISYEYELGGLNLVSHVKGTLDGKKLSGTYRATARDGGEAMDSGAWSAQRQD